MGLRINTNIQSLSAQRYLGINSNAQKESLEHLSSGSRINRAADDAAGLAISEKMKGVIRSIHQDVRNANDGISLIQTAEGGMNEIGNALIRFRELAIQGASDTVGEEERSFINKEVQQLKQEITRISSATEFNGRKLLSGEGEPLDIQIGIHNNPVEDRLTIDPSSINVTLEHLGLTNLNTLTKESSRDALSSIDNAQRTMLENRAEVGSFQNRLLSVVGSLNVYDENLSAANSRIRDTDMASETANLAKNNILTSVSVSILSQANQNPMTALKLVG